jgi:hypothetical protein
MSANFEGSSAPSRMTNVTRVSAQREAIDRL